jgi:hypothetical protein
MKLTGTDELGPAPVQPENPLWKLPLTTPAETLEADKRTKEAKYARDRWERVITKLLKQVFSRE